MTKQEAIRILEQSCPKRPQKLWSIKRKEAVKMAIEALQRGLENVVADSCSEKPNRSDTIYRQDAIDVAKQHWYKPDIAKALEELPSAQPEIIRCKDCKWYGRADKRRFYRGTDCLNHRIDTIVPDKDYCSRAERRTDE